MNPKIELRCLVDGEGGLGRWARYVGLGLAERGYDVVVHPTRVTPSASLFPGFFKLIDGDGAKGRLVIVLEAASRIARYMEGADIACCLWESTRWPKETIIGLEKARLVLTGSKWNGIGLRESGLQTRVGTIHLGIDPRIYHPNGMYHERFSFMAAGSEGNGRHRKNFDAINRAFAEAFPGTSECSLFIKKAPCDARSSEQQPVGSYEAYLYAEESQMASWYKESDVFVSASRAEGWGLHLHEAMACGCFPIACRYGGQAEFFDGRFGIELPYKTEVPAEGEQLALGEWAVPTHEGLVEAMRYAFEHRNELGVKRELAANRAATFTWSRTVDELEDYIRKL